MKSLKRIYLPLLLVILFGSTAFAQMPVTKSSKKNQESIEAITAKASLLENDSYENIKKDEIRLHEEKNKIAQWKKNLEVNTTKYHPQDEVMSADKIAKKKAYISQLESKVKALETSIETRKQKLAASTEENKK